MRPLHQKRTEHIDKRSTILFSPVPGRDAAFAALGKLEITTGANEIVWDYGVNMKRTPTYGGEVIQILSFFADKMTISGVCRNYIEQREIYEYFKNYISYVTGWTSGKKRQQKFLKFEYPARQWSFVIMVTDISGMRMAVDQAAPEWKITAEIVSENDRYALGTEASDVYSAVLNKVVPRSTRSAAALLSRSARSGALAPGQTGSNTDVFVEDDDEDGAPSSENAPVNFRLLKDEDPFGDLMDFMNGDRGAIADNFDALVAAWATGSVETLRSNPLSDPLVSAEEIWRARFGTDSPFSSGGIGGTSGAVGDSGGFSFGPVLRVWGTTFGGPKDPAEKGDSASGKDLNDYPDSFAELATNPTNFAPRAPMKNSYNALGGLEFETPVLVTNPQNGKSITVYKRDVGFGSRGKAPEDPKIDLWHMASAEIGFNGWGWLDIQIGTPGGSEGDTLAGVPIIKGSVAFPTTKMGNESEWKGRTADHAVARAWGNWQSDYAIDIFRPAGTPVYAVADGVLETSRGPSGSFPYSGTTGNPYGLSMYLRTDKYGRFWYTHLRQTTGKDRNGNRLVPGSRVKVGDLIGWVSEWTGSPHLHFAAEETYRGKGVLPRNQYPYSKVEEFLKAVKERG